MLVAFHTFHGNLYLEIFWVIGRSLRELNISGYMVPYINSTYSFKKWLLNTFYKSDTTLSWMIVIEHLKNVSLFSKYIFTHPCVCFHGIKEIASQIMEENKLFNKQH